MNPKNQGNFNRDEEQLLNLILENSISNKKNDKNYADPNIEND